MANRKRKGRPVSGWLILDKPVGTSSSRAVAVVKRIFNAQKAGHAGTLDPLATGCLPIALGEATKTMSQIVESGKTYRFTVTWGAETETDDKEGRTVAHSPFRPSRDAIETAMTDFVGTIEQIPPAFSAIKIDGERAYDLARDGESVTLKAREVVITRFDLISMPDDDHAVFEIDCGKGTYVRSVARDIGRALCCNGHVSELRRLRVGPFGATEMVEIETLQREADESGLEGCDALLKPVEAALGDLPGVALPRDDVNRVLRGQPVLLRGASAPTAGPAFATGGGQLLALGEIVAGSFHPKRVFRF